MQLGAVKGGREQVGGSEADSFRAMRARLLAVELPLQPWFDAWSFARTALLVADCMAQPTVTQKLGELAKVKACDPRCIVDLLGSARALLHVLGEIGDRPRRASRVPGPTDANARALRSSMVELIEHELADDDEARLWLEVVRTARDDDDLVFDLRSLAYLYRLHREKLKKVCDVGGDELRARTVADALEQELAGKTTASEWNDWLARAFALLAVIYDEACRVARFVSHGETQVDFASLVGIARARRRQPRLVSAAPPAPTTPPPLPPAASPDPPPLLESKRPAPPPLPAVPPPLPEKLVELEEVVSVPSSRPPSRAHERRAVELEVDFASDSNFYMGFAENLSGGGVFVATYVLRPLGTILELSIRLAGDLEALHVRGQVRWTREPSRSGNLWPGMGVCFHDLAPEDEVRIRAFLVMRDPLFFEE